MQVVSRVLHKGHVSDPAAERGPGVKLPKYLRNLGAALVGKSANWQFDRIPLDNGGQAPDLTQPYRQSVWVMRAIKTVAGPIAAVPTRFSLDRRGSDSLYEDPVLEVFWNKPAAGLTRSDFIEASIGWLKLSGECFWLLDDTWLRPFPEVATNWPPIILARPDKMRHIVKNGILEGWEYIDAQGKQHYLLAEQVIHTKLWNPYHPWRGLGEMQAATIAAKADFQAGTFNLNLMEANGDQGVYVVAKGGMPGSDQKEQIIAALREKRRRQKNGEFLPTFITGDVSIEDPKIQTPDANFHQGRLQNRHEIFIALGVPPSMADVIASYSVGSASDRFRLIEDTCMPLAEKLADSVEILAGKQTGKPVSAWFDWDEHSVMQQVRAERIETGSKLWSQGMPMKKVNDYLQLGLPEYEGWETGYLPFNLAPTSEVSGQGPAQPPETDPAYAETDPDETTEDKSIHDMLLALKHHKAKKNRDPKELAQWKTHMAARRQSVKAFESKFKRILLEARKETLEKLEGNTPAKILHTVGKAAAADFLFNLFEWTGKLLAGMRKVASVNLIDAGQGLFKEIGKDDPFTMPQAQVLSYLNLRDNYLKGVADNVYETIKLDLTEGLEAGESIEDLAMRIRASFTKIGKDKARRIAMTETAACYGYARQASMEQAGIKKKRWLTSGNSNVRPAHAAANGQTVDLNDNFEVGGEQLKHPSDSHGSAGNVINCHCISIAVADEEENKS